MSIDKFSGIYILTYDICGKDAPETFDDFYNAVQYKKDNGWESQKCDGQWEDVCPECQESEVEYDD
jgi:hypothetical protein